MYYFKVNKIEVYNEKIDLIVLNSSTFYKSEIK